MIRFAKLDMIQNINYMTLLEINMEIVMLELMEFQNQLNTKFGLGNCTIMGFEIDISDDSMTPFEIVYAHIESIINNLNQTLTEHHNDWDSERVTSQIEMINNIERVFNEWNDLRYQL